MWDDGDLGYRAVFRDERRYTSIDGVCQEGSFGTNGSRGFGVRRDSGLLDTRQRYDQRNGLEWPSFESGREIAYDFFDPTLDPSDFLGD